MFDEPEPVMIGAGIELTAAIVARDSPLDGSDSANDQKTIGADINMVALQLASLEREIMAGKFSRDPEVRAGHLPLLAVWFDAPSGTTFVGDEVRELMFQGAP